jgi:serine protease
LDADLAWDITTGGVTASGDTIVVCVIDDGLSLTHPDFAGNVWVNRAETPGNGRDDDGNGYIDDYRGWNFSRNNDNISNNGSHGTEVAGIIGARGNNGIGMTGVNWNVKLMIVGGDNVPGTEAQAIAAYSYPLTMRRRYNASDGRQGAFVVATNSSWGAPNSFARDAPLWCAMYDSLGTQGILNVGATANTNVNVDVKGDLPSTCPSDYLIVVTSLNDKGELVQDAGYGIQNVDIGAFGENVWTTKKPDTYGSVRGTSFAAPQVAGAIGLLYSVPCPGFAALYKSDPKTAAVLMRQYILQGATPKSGLANYVATGGRLNLYRAIQQLTGNCTDCFAPTSIQAIDITDKVAKLTWLRNSKITRIDLRWRAVGATNWTEVMNVNSGYALNNLQACTNYEFQLKAYCGNTVLDYIKSVTFKTDGCCVPPSNPQIIFIGGNAATIRWAKVLAASSYTVRSRVKGTTTWQTSTTTTLSIILNVMVCTEYELQLASTCNGSLSEFSNITTFRTPNCGACRDLQYCVPDNLDASAEWIASVKLGNLLNTSGSNEGYGDYTGTTPNKFALNSTYELELKPGYASIPYEEYFVVWIDFNQDGTFSTAEAIFQQSSKNGALKANIKIPGTAKLGISRLRVAMQFLTPGGPCTFNTTQGGAEVEDYCVEIVQSTGVNDLEQTTSLNVFPNPFAEQILVELKLPESQTQSSLEIINAVGQIIQKQALGNLLQGSQIITLDAQHLPAGFYFIRYQNEAGKKIMKKVVKQ